jgi:hypothetical protein
MNFPEALPGHGLGRIYHGDTEDTEVQQDPLVSPVLSVPLWFVMGCLSGIGYLFGEEWFGWNR